MLQNFIGKIRTPRYVVLTLVTYEPDAEHKNGYVKLHFHAHTQDEKPAVVFQQNYEGRLLQAQSVMDLLSWFRHTATSFFGSQHGGL